MRSLSRTVVVLGVLLLVPACSDSDDGDQPGEIDRIDAPAEVDPSYRPLDDENPEPPETDG